MSERDGAFVPDPLLGGYLGLGILAAASKSLSAGLLLGAGTAICSVILGAVLPPLRRNLPERFRPPASLALSTVLALAYGALADAYFPAVATGLWLYLPLIAVNSMSLHAIRLSAAHLERKTDSIGWYAPIARRAFAYALLASLLGAFREAAGLGVLTLPRPGMEPLRIVLAEAAPLRILAAPAGGFILLGFLAAIYRTALRAAGRRIP